jgi:hypothetical protein
MVLSYDPVKSCPALVGLNWKQANACLAVALRPKAFASAFLGVP